MALPSDPPSSVISSQTRELHVSSTENRSTNDHTEHRPLTDPPFEPLPSLPGTSDRESPAPSDRRSTGTFFESQSPVYLHAEPVDASSSSKRRTGITTSPATSSTSLNTFGTSAHTHNDGLPTLHALGEDKSSVSIAASRSTARPSDRPSSAKVVRQPRLSSAHVDDEIEDVDGESEDDADSLFNDSDGDTAHAAGKASAVSAPSAQSKGGSSRLTSRSSGIQIRRWTESVPLPPPRNGHTGLPEPSSSEPYADTHLATSLRPAPTSRKLVDNPTPNQPLARSDFAAPPRRTLRGNDGGIYAQDSTTVARRTLQPHQATAKNTSRNFQDLSDASSQRSASERSFYRASAAQTELGNFVPDAMARPGATSFGIANLPDWSQMRSDSLTSRPITHVQRDMDWSLRRLLSQKVFEDLLADPLGRHRFREYLVQHECDEQRLDLLFDVSHFQKQVSALKFTAEAIHEVYLADTAYGRVTLPDDIDEEAFESLQNSFALKASLESVQKHLLRSLYHNEFQRFIKEQLVQQTKVKLGLSDFDPEELTGLGDCFCLTNPRLRENPIVLVSDAFSVITGYPRQAIIGRNCRFLQGPGTAPDSIQRVRDALNSGQSCTELLLNYRRDGTPFWCLLNIIPLRESDGRLAYFIGGQTNVTGTLASSKGLSFLIAGAADSQEVPPTEYRRGMDGQEVSPSMARYIGSTRDVTSGNDAAIVNVKEGVGIYDRRPSVPSARTRAVAAGAYEPADMTPSNGELSLDVAPGQRAAKRSLMSKMLDKVGVNGPPRSRTASAPGNSMVGTQKLEGAEVGMRKDAHTLEDQMSYFTDVYSKLLVVRRQKREVLFATLPLLRFLNLPCSTASDVFASPLVHADLLSLLCGVDSGETRAVRTAVQDAVRRGEGISVVTGVRMPGKNRAARLLGGARSSTDITYATMHLCPLKDRDNSSFAMVAVFS